MKDLKIIVSDITAQKVLDFWFSEENESKWFLKSEDFDIEIRNQFGNVWCAACEGLLDGWRKSIYGRLAEIIVLDQFSRNLCRNDAAAFAQDPMALILSQEATIHPDFDQLKMSEKKFLIMPFMHSESKEIHNRAVPLFEALGDAHTLDFEIKHKEIIDCFGRYPHRNDVLGRPSTQEEIDFLKEPGSSF